MYNMLLKTELKKKKKITLTDTNCLRAEIWHYKCETQRCTFPAWCWSMSFESRVSKVWQMSIRWQQSHRGLKRSPRLFYLKYRAVLLISCLWILYLLSFEYQNPHCLFYSVGSRRTDFQCHSLWINKTSFLCNHVKRPVRLTHLVKSSAGCIDLWFSIWIEHQCYTCLSQIRATYCDTTMCVTKNIQQYTPVFLHVYTSVWGKGCWCFFNLITPLVTAELTTATTRRRTHTHTRFLYYKSIKCQLHLLYMTNELKCCAQCSHFLCVFECAFPITMCVLQISIFFLYRKCIVYTVYCKCACSIFALHKVISQIKL